MKALIVSFFGFFPVPAAAHKAMLNLVFIAAAAILTVFLRIVDLVNHKYSPFLLHSTTTSLYIDCRSNLYAGSPSYLLILFSALSAFAVGGLSIERNQKPLAPEITLAVTHHDRQKQVEVKRSSRVNPHEIRLFSGCPYAVVK